MDTRKRYKIYLDETVYRAFKMIAQSNGETMQDYASRVLAEEVRRHFARNGNDISQPSALIDPDFDDFFP